MEIRRAVSANVSLSSSSLNEMSHELFQTRVSRAIRDFPSYAEKVESFMGRTPVADEKLLLGSLPIWRRADQNKLMASMSESSCEKSFIHSTGGSTGVPMRFYVTRESYEWRSAVSDRGYSWAGAEDGRRRFYVWGASISPPSVHKRIKSRLEDSVKKRKYFDSFRFDDERKAECCRQINQYKPDSVVGYAGNLVELAMFVRDNPSALDWKAESAITAAEGLRPGQREVIEEYITKELFLSYGSREFMLIGMECSKHNGYHVSSDNLFVEVVDDEGKHVSDGETGRILVTDLHNDANPFVRYEIGDMGTYTDKQCDCGLPFPLIASVDGRAQEVIYKPDGSKLTALFIPHLMKEFKWIDGYQIRQEHKDAIIVDIITNENLSDELCAPVKTALSEKLGDDMGISFRVVGKLEKTKSGKTPIVIVKYLQEGR